MFAAMAKESRLRIMQLLLSAHPAGLVAREIQEELGISASNLSHHLDKLKNEELVRVSRDGTYLRYTTNIEALQEILTFLYASAARAIRQSSRKASCKSEIGYGHGKHYRNRKRKVRPGGAARR